MGYKNRELEVKLVTDRHSYKEVEAAIEKLLDESWEQKIVGRSKDVYWHTPRNINSDFVRVRYFPESDRGQLTLKHADKDNNVDRVEIDVEIHDPDQAVAYNTYLLGAPAKEVVKKYSVYLLDHKDTSVSVYRVAGDLEDRIFVEVEARTRDALDKLIKRIESLELNLNREARSIYRMFVK